jgi:hypothetical protein
MYKISSILVLLFQFTFCQSSDINTASSKLEVAYNKLLNNPNGKLLQLIYIKSFPQDWNTFLGMLPEDDSEFQSSANKYIDVLDTLIFYCPTEVGELLINWATKIKWWPYSHNYVQHELAKYSNVHTDLFVSLFNKKSNTERENIIKYLADHENHAYYEEYQNLINNLFDNHENKLAEQFETARRNRMKESR